MKKIIYSLGCLIAAGGLSRADNFDVSPPPVVPRFSVTNMDRSVSPAVDFYQFAAGGWIKHNPVPADKSRWAGFDELQQRNWYLIRDLLEKAARNDSAPSNSPQRQVGDFFASAMDTDLINAIGTIPLQVDFARIAAMDSSEKLMRLTADFQLRNVIALFDTGASPDEKNSAVYALELGQGGLSLPDRDYYLSDGFAKQRAAFAVHVAKMFTLAGEQDAEAQLHAATVLDLETTLAKASKSRTDLRDPIANYHKFTVSEAVEKYPELKLLTFLDSSGIQNLTNVIIGQPEFFTALDQLVKTRPLDDWKVYLRWHVLHRAAPCLQKEIEDESFAFYGTVLSGQLAQEPRWQRASRRIDGSIGEALGQLYVAKYYPPTAEGRMAELIANLKDVLRDRLGRVDWMTEPTRTKALAKFATFNEKIGHPAKFRDYSQIEIRRDDYLGNVERAAIFESRRELARVGKSVDKSEWHMTPQTVNAYYSSSQNEIVFPAGILEPPFFDVDMDDAVNYGGIGVVIGHEMTHGFDDQGRKFDEHGNLNDWWTDEDAKAFEARAQKLVDQFNGYEALPGVHVNGRLTLGENIADLGGLTIAYEALERALAREPSRRRIINGFTPEQRFFLAFAQVWRTNWREAALRRAITIDPHSPGQFRAIGAPVNVQDFFKAFDIKSGDPMWRAPESRAIIW